MAAYDATRRMGGKRLNSTNFLAATQHRLGLNVTSLSQQTSTLRAGDYLGDYELNRADRSVPHDNVLDVWAQVYRAAGDAKVMKGDKQEGSAAAARFDQSKIADILREKPNGTLIGTEIKCLNTVRSEYGKGTRGSHCDNGHVYGFGSTREHVMRTIIGAQQQGSLSDGYFDHATGKGYIDGGDWENTKDGTVKPDYKDAITRAP